MKIKDPFERKPSVSAGMMGPFSDASVSVIGCSNKIPLKSPILLHKNHIEEKKVPGKTAFKKSQKQKVQIDCVENSLTVCFSISPNEIKTHLQYERLHEPIARELLSVTAFERLLRHKVSPFEQKV